MFISAISDDIKRTDCEQLLQLFEAATSRPAKMWGAAIVGFGNYHYKYESGHEGDAPLVAFSPRANAISLYLSSKFPSREELLHKLGRHKTGKACIYIKRLSDVHTGVLQEMIKDSFEFVKQNYS